MNSKVVQLEDYKAVAEKLITIISHIVSEKGSANIAVSGGSTPLRIFEIFRDSDSVDWEKVRIFWVDERIVPVESEENNFGNAKRIFEKNPDFPLDILYPMDTKGENLAHQYAKVLKKYDAETLDLILLGIGDDGHTASIFPGQNHLFDAEGTVALSHNPYSKQPRITLTGNSIFNAEQSIFIALGAGKKEVLKNITSAENINKYPACRVFQQHSNVLLFTDVVFD